MKYLDRALRFLTTKGASQPPVRRLLLSHQGRSGGLQREVPVSKGFTMVEVMIVVAVVGILSAVALPNYLRARALAEASASILEAVAFAEQCAVAHKSGLPVTVNPPGGPSRNCDNTIARQIVSRRWSGDATGVRCLGVTAGSNHRQATLLVSGPGGMSPITGIVSCSFQP